MLVKVRDTITNSLEVRWDRAAGLFIGRDASCQVTLGGSRFVSPKHIQVDKGEQGWELRLLPNTNEVWLDGKLVMPGEVRLLANASHRLQIDRYEIEFETNDEAHVETDRVAQVLNQRLKEFHAALVSELDPRQMLGSGVTQFTPENVNAAADRLFAKPEFSKKLYDDKKVRREQIRILFEARLIDELLGDKREPEPGPRRRLRNLARIDAHERQAEEVQRALAKTLVLDRAGEIVEQLVRIEHELPHTYDEIEPTLPDALQNYLVQSGLKRTVGDIIYGLGPLQDLVDRPDVSEIMVISPSKVYVERALGEKTKRRSEIIRARSRFFDDESVQHVISKILDPIGRKVDMSQPMVDGRLPDGSRLNAVIPPVALHGSSLTIRKFPSKPITAEDLLSFGSVTEPALALLSASVRAKKNIVVAGGTGTGKTTFLNVLTAMIPSDERIVTIEDAAEMQPQQEHVVALETKPANTEGKGAYEIRDLLRNALRMRPDRIVVGECRGGEALDMLQAMNTGHAGSLTTVHANSSEHTVSRLETMIIAGQKHPMPLEAIRRQIAEAVDLIVHIISVGRRRMVGQITEVLRIDPVSGEVDMRDIFTAQGVVATAQASELLLEPTGYLPTFTDNLVEACLLDLGSWLGGQS